MKKHITSTIVLILLLSVFDSCLYAGTYSGGTGEPDNPYKIAAVADWQELMATTADWDKSFLLTADIDLVGVTLTPVGNIEMQFTGILDGDNHVIRNAVISQQPHIDTTGIFGHISNGGQIRNLGAEDVNMTGLSSIGGLVGWNEAGSITNCYSTGFLNGYSHIGGLVGSNGGSITSSYSTASVSGYDHVGGLVGAGMSGSVSDCCSTGSVSGSWYVGGLVGLNAGSIVSCDSSSSVNGGSGNEWRIGGLVGYNTGSITSCRSSSSVTLTREHEHAREIGGLVGYNDSSITSCCSTGTVSTAASGMIYNVGGLAGYNYQGWITSCSSTGAANGTESVGGLVGLNESGSITSCYSTGTVNGNYHVGGLVGTNNSGSLNSCYATGPVSGAYYVGGFAGQNNGSMAFCYSVGFVNGTGDHIGGLAGDSMMATSCFWDTQTSGQTVSAGGTDKTTAEMKMLSTFNTAGWDFVEVWGIGENQTYPYLRTETAGDLNHDKKVDFMDFAVLASHWLEGVVP